MKTICGIGVLLFVMPAMLAGQEAAPINFSRQILPILSEKCFVCHGPDAQEDSLVRLDSFEGAIDGAIDIDALADSQILVRIHDESDPMPPEESSKQLSDDEKRLLTQWVNSGGKYTKHWAFVVPVKQPLPVRQPVRGEQLVPGDLPGTGEQPVRGEQLSPAKNADSVKRPVTGERPVPVKQSVPAEQSVPGDQFGGDQQLGSGKSSRPPEPRGGEGDIQGVSRIIDGFISQQHQQAGIGFAEAADPATLARRVALVITGLPPEPEWLDRILVDPSPEAYEQFVDTLLASRRYGEHQARYWLDAVRYGDTHGLHLDNRRGIYPYRDWVVKAFNDNLPMDDFITWQLAGDLLPNPTLPQKVATGFVRLNPSTAEGGAIPAEFQAKNNFDRVETVGTVFLGMSLTCARCHTHKYDPITQREYYQLLAFFNSTAEPAMDGNKYEYGTVVKAPENQAAWSEWETTSAARDRLISDAESQLPELTVSQAQRKHWNTISSSDRLGMIASPDGPFAGQNIHVYAQVVQSSLRRAVANFTTTLVAQDLPQPRPTKLLQRGEYHLPVGDPLEPGILEVMGAFPDGAPGNRLGLAQWLTSPEHPLTSRVMVNQIWQRVFGNGLVRTPEDFGVQGQQPTHPELLDWLAVDFQESGWDVKRLIKAMVSSHSFRQSSAWRANLDDPENRLFSRGPSYRLDAEVLRDTGLWASQLLDPTMGGEGVKPYQPPGMWLAMAHPGSNTKNYVQDQGAKLYRRSLYVYWKRTSPHPMMTLFDAPSREASCVRRTPTNTALQSLALMNETQRIEMARKLAARLIRDQKTDSARIEQLFRLLACRPPTNQEAAACAQLLNSMLARFENDNPSAEELLRHGAAERAKKIDVAQHAAWTQVAATVLASDIAILLY